MQCQFVITQIQEELTKAQQELAPRKKFAFSKRAAVKESTTPTLLAERTEKIELVLDGIKDQTDVKIYKTQSDLVGVSSYQLQHLKNSEIIISAKLNAIHLVGLENCQIYIGAVSGAAHITDCTNCIINVACHQLRIHQTYKTQFYVFTATSPIVENVSELGFGEYRFKYAQMATDFENCGLTGTNQYDQVQDFK